MTIRCVDLRCERLVTPIGLDNPRPRLTWRLDVDAGETDVVQLALQVEVDGRWDTGRVDGWRQQVTYAGPPLAARAIVRWRVRVWTTAGDSTWSDWATFETGVMDPADWDARMITADVETPVVRFSRQIDVPEDLARARLRLTAHGLVTATINGVAVSDDVLAPGWTSYRHRLFVRTHDVTALLQPGETELATLVAPGWFSGRLGFEDKNAHYGTHRGLFAQLELQLGDGTLAVIGTDETWTASSTPYLLADIYDGETYDARRGFGDPQPARVIEFDPTVLRAPTAPPVRRTQELRPVARHGNVFDFGQNLVGWLRLRLSDVPPGTEVVLRHAEVLDADGGLFTEPLRTAKATDTYVASGAAEEVYEPQFTFHGFRFAEITGIDVDCVDVDVEAVVVHSDLERTGTFTCSDPLINRLHENVVWGLRGNFVSVPTDCPQRDERLGWTGDAQVFAPTASFLFDTETFWEGWLADLAVDQRADGAVPVVVPDLGLSIVGAAGWGDAVTVVPWATYLAYGDDTVLRSALASMKAWVDYVWTRLDDGVWSRDFQFGDWLDPDAPAERPWQAKAHSALVATAYASWSATLLARSATIVGDSATATAASERASAARKAWWTHYAEEAKHTQTGAALAIAFGLAPDGDAVNHLGAALVKTVADANGHLATGFLGTPLLLPSLTATGHVDVAYDLLTQRTAPSWLYQVLAGATTIWERWDALRPDGSVVTDALDGGSSMVSFNHYAYGAVADWLHGAVAGIRPDPDDPGYHHVLIEPTPGGGLTSASAALMTRYGQVGVEWHLDGDEMRCEIELPPNSSATVRLPGETAVRLGSGRHTLRR